MPQDGNAIILSWEAEESPSKLLLKVRPKLTGRDYHVLHSANPSLRELSSVQGQCVSWKPYPSIPELKSISNGSFRSDPLWFHKQYYSEEDQRGFPCEEDTFSPGVFFFSLDKAARLVFYTGTSPSWIQSPEKELERVRALRLKDGIFKTAAKHFIFDREGTRSIIAGYPWFSDWGRDTFIALRGLCGALDDVDTAFSILGNWSALIKDGLIPNRIPDVGEEPDYNSVDATLWFIVAAWETLTSARRGDPASHSKERQAIVDAVASLLDGLIEGTIFSIGVDTDGLLMAGEPGVQLTWMDAKIGDRVITPRIGKPVEIQALWYNALWAGFGLTGDTRYQDLAELVERSFYERYLSSAQPALPAFLPDVVDVNHRKGEIDWACRPNQVFAFGGLPLSLCSGDKWRPVMERIVDTLVTPYGVRSLAPTDPQYRGECAGGPVARDEAYHQGTAWMWLLGACVEGWMRTSSEHASFDPKLVQWKYSESLLQEAKQKFFSSIIDEIASTGSALLPEISDGNSPFTFRGAPFQAWSSGECIRLLTLMGYSR